MTIRVRLKLIWAFCKEKQGPFSKIEDYTSHAQRVLVDTFSHYKAEMHITKTENFSSNMIDLHIDWDVNLDGVPGSWHNAEDHIEYAKTYLREQIQFFTLKLEVVQVLRQADFDEALDHGEILREARENNVELVSSDYPVFIPETEESWPEAKEVFLQDTHWFWREVDPETGDTTSGPAAGPKPKKIWTAWEADYRERAYAKFKREMELEELQAG
jgi:hypothetical protein